MTTCPNSVYKLPRLNAIKTMIAGPEVITRNNAIN